MKSLGFIVRLSNPPKKNVMSLSVEFIIAQSTFHRKLLNKSKHNNYNQVREHTL